MPIIKNNFSLVALGIVAVSLLPMVIEIIKARRRQPVYTGIWEPHPLAAVGDPLPDNCQKIEVHISQLNQLFNAMDPAPFRERDLDPNAEEFIVGWARELHQDRPLALVVQLDREAGDGRNRRGPEGRRQQVLPERARVTRQKLRLLFRTGRRSLVIGLLFLAATVLLGDLIAKHA